MAKFLYSWGVLFRFVQFLVGRIKKRNNNNNKNRFFLSNPIHISIVIVCLFGICHCYGGIYSYSIRVFFDCHFNGRIISLMSRMSHRENYYRVMLTWLFIWKIHFAEPIDDKYELARHTHTQRSTNSEWRKHRHSKLT